MSEKQDPIELLDIAVKYGMTADRAIEILCRLNAETHRAEDGVSDCFCANRISNTHEEGYRNDGETIRRIILSTRAFAGHDPAECVVVTREDLRCAITALGELIDSGCHHKESDEPAYNRLSAAVEEKP